MPRPASAHVEALDLLRGLAALAVALYHFTTNAGYLSAGNPLRLVGQWGYLGVQVFFVISAFVIPYALHASGYTWRHAGTFLAKRVVRIYPPYLVSLAVVVAGYYLSRWLLYDSVYALDERRLALHLLYLNEWLDVPWLSDIYWTLAVEFQYYLLMAALFPLVASPRKGVALAALGAYHAVDVVLPFGRHVFGYSLLFILGIVVFRYKVGLDDRRWFAGLAALVLAAIWHFYGYKYFAASVVPFLGILSLRRGPAWATWLGAVSYSLYLFHLPFGGTLIDGVEELVEGEVLRSAFVGVALAVSLGAAWLAYRWVEAPAIGWSKRLRYRRPAAALAPRGATSRSTGDGLDTVPPELAVTSVEEPA